jgi:hypothetical protein
VASAGYCFSRPAARNTRLAARIGIDRVLPAHVSRQFEPRVNRLLKSARDLSGGLTAAAFAARSSRACDIYAAWDQRGYIALDNIQQLRQLVR